MDEEPRQQNQPVTSGPAPTPQPAPEPTPTPPPVVSPEPTTEPPHHSRRKWYVVGAAALILALIASAVVLIAQMTTRPAAPKIKVDAHFHAYVIALRLMIALVIKLNDDFCLSAQEQSNSEDPK